MMMIAPMTRSLKWRRSDGRHRRVGLGNVFAVSAYVGGTRSNPIFSHFQYRLGVAVAPGGDDRGRHLRFHPFACSEPNDTHRTLAMIVTLHLIETRRSDGLLH